MTSTISTYVFEKNPLLREGLKSFLAGTNFKVTAEFKCISEIDHAHTAELPHIIIVGISQQGSGQVNGKPHAEFKEKIHQIKSRLPGTPLVILISQEDMSSTPDILSWNADSYILRDISADALLSYLNLAMMGEKILPAPMATLLANGHENGKVNGNAADARNGHDLSEREADIIKCLIEGDSNKLIAQHLRIAEATVKVHLKTILRKLGVHNRTQVALWAVRHGFENYSHRIKKGSDISIAA